MQQETIVKYIIGILALVIIAYITYMFFTQAGGKTKWILYQDDSGTVPYVSDIVREYQCMSKIELCAAIGSGAAFEQCNAIELSKTCDIFCGKYCEKQNKHASCESWGQLKSILCHKNDLYKVTITQQKNNGEIVNIATKKNENTDKLNILTFDTAIENKDGEKITIDLLKATTNLDFKNCYIIYISNNDKISITQFTTSKDLSEKDKHLITVSCLLGYSGDIMDTLCGCT